MISLRGSEITLQPLSLFETGKVFDHLMALKACNPPDDMLRPENRSHLLAVIAAGVRRHVSDVTEQEVEEALDMGNIGAVLLALVPREPTFTHQEIGHV
jgi:hypothetical protein